MDNLPVLRECVTSPWLSLSAIGPERSATLFIAGLMWFHLLMDIFYTIGSLWMLALFKLLFCVSFENIKIQILSFLIWILKTKTFKKLFNLSCKIQSLEQTGWNDIVTLYFKNYVASFVCISICFANCAGEVSTWLALRFTKCSPQEWALSDSAPPDFRQWDFLSIPMSFLNFSPWWVTTLWATK